MTRSPVGSEACILLSELSISTCHTSPLLDNNSNTQRTAIHNNISSQKNTSIIILTCKKINIDNNNKGRNNQVPVWKDPIQRTNNPIGSIQRTNNRQRKRSDSDGSSEKNVTETTNEPLLLHSGKKDMAGLINNTMATGGHIANATTGGHVANTTTAEGTGVRTEVDEQVQVTDNSVSEATQQQPEKEPIEIVDSKVTTKSDVTTDDVIKL